MFYDQNVQEIIRKNEKRKKELELSIQRMNEELKVFFEELESIKQDLTQQRNDFSSPTQKEDPAKKNSSQEGKKRENELINPSWLFVR